MCIGDAHIQVGFTIAQLEYNVLPFSTIALIRGVKQHAEIAFRRLLGEHVT